MAKDPVCGMQVDVDSARHITQHEGTIYYFCAPGCKKAFETDPKKFLDPNYKAGM